MALRVYSAEMERGDFPVTRRAGLGVAWSHWYMAGWNLVSSLDGCITYWKWKISNLWDLFDWEGSFKKKVICQSRKLIHGDWYLSKAMGHGPSQRCTIYCISPKFQALEEIRLFCNGVFVVTFLFLSGTHFTSDVSLWFESVDASFWRSKKPSSFPCYIKLQFRIVLSRNKYQLYLASSR